MKNLRMVIGAVGSLALLFAVAPARARAPQADKASNMEIQTKASEARTPAQHAAVAKDYRVRAEGFEAQAKVHEAKAAKLDAQPRPPFEQKFPGLTRRAGNRERSLAMQAWRAAQESRELANYHLAQAVEKGLGDVAEDAQAISPNQPVTP